MTYRDNLRFLFLPIIGLLIGISLIGLGIYETITSPTKDFESVTGYFYGSTLYESESYDPLRNENHAATYKLTYRFTVDSKEYFVTSESSTAFIPAIDTPSEILYNPNNPNEAVIGGPKKRSTFIIFFGLFFSLGSLAFFPGHINNIKYERQSKNKTSKKEKRSDRSAPKVDLFGVYLGALLVFVGYGSICIISSSFSITGIINYCLTSFTLPMLIPIILVVGGLYSIIQFIFFNRKNH